MKKAILFLNLIICTINLFSQTKIEDYLEGRKFKNAGTGLILQYGYISSLNTNGITFTNGYGDKFYFMNCSKRISSDGTFMVLTECMNPQNGSGLGTIYAYRTKLIVKASDGQLQYDLVGETQSQSSAIYPTNVIAPSTIIGKSIKIGSLVVAQHDFPDMMNWLDAKSACERQGEGWRLPTKDELNILYQNKNKIGGFAGHYYCSFTEYTDGIVLLKDFNNGKQNYGSKDGRYNVRAVRTN